MNITPTCVAETDDEVITRIQSRYEILTKLTHAVKAGHIRSLIVTGPPGVGKTKTVQDVMEEYFVRSILEDDGKFKNYELIKGSTSAVGLYKTLYDYSNSKSVLIFDDCNNMFRDTESIDLLLGALDSTKNRIISWNKASKWLEGQGVPNQFEFKGGCIFLTNINFDMERNSNRREQLAALKSRAQYMDMKLNTMREKILCIKMKIEAGMLNSYQFSNEQVNSIFKFMVENQYKLDEVSLRTVKNIADLVAAFGDDELWKMMAVETQFIK